MRSEAEEGVSARAAFHESHDTVGEADACDIGRRSGSTSTAEAMQLGLTTSDDERRSPDVISTAATPQKLVQKNRQMLWSVALNSSLPPAVDHSAVIISRQTRTPHQ